MHLLGRAAYLDTNGGGTAKTEVKQHQVWQSLFQYFPVFGFIGSRSYDFCLGYIVPDDTQRTLHFEGHVLNYDYFELFHKRVI